MLLPYVVWVPYQGLLVVRLLDVALRGVSRDIQSLIERLLLNPLEKVVPVLVEVSGIHEELIIRLLLTLHVPLRDDFGLDEI